MSAVLERVIDCIATTTRYPRHVLLPDADLENDLGIDSVKRVEIITVLSDAFQLDLTKKERDPAIRTIGQVAAWIESYLASSGTASPAPRPALRIDVAATMRDVAPLVRPGIAEPMAPLPTRPSVPTHPANERRHVDPRAVPMSGPPDVNEFNMLGSATPQGSLRGRVAFVTGSGRGVGRTIARVLAARGATVFVNSFHSREAGEETVNDIKARGGNAIPVWGSVANPEHVSRMFATIEQQAGYLDILVCNASDGKIGSFEEISQEDWDRAFRTNVSGHHQCAMLASRLMQRRGGGSIVTMSSIGAHRYVQGLGGQGVVKAAVESLTRYLACELAVHGIRTNCVSGGPVYGDVMAQYPDARATHNYWESIVPDGELCSPMDLAT
ncbi:MAG TPA: SDR family oxidoreductase, partial [Pirellulaceae bacterium]